MTDESNNLNIIKSLDAFARANSMERTDSISAGLALITELLGIETALLVKTDSRDWRADHVIGADIGLREGMEFPLEGTY